ncbi:MAG TPA: LysR family transcriptional regulator [Alphaproteobacteria bacterium]|nr:LysR family transcriptional regulator [Alphaproteobacteria bacterium]
MDVNLRQIRAFMAVARFGSFTRAAQLLHLSQPALTVQIRQLEQGLGVRLFDRNTRTVSLTAVGRELIPAFQRLLQEFDAVVVNAKDLAAKRHGVVRLACLPSFASTVLPEIIAGFRRRHPRVSFVLKDAVGKRILSMVRGEEVDFGIGVAAAEEPDLETLYLMQDRMHVVFPARHPLARARNVSLDNLRAYPLVLMDPESTVRALVDAAFARRGRLAVPACEATYMSSAIGMVRAGLGVTILPSTAMELRANPRLRSKPIDDPGLTRRIVIVRKAKRSLSPAAESFIDELLAATPGSRKDARPRLVRAA